ncbi:Lipase B [Fulvia fulva]|uniref:Lipase B n=1 Tax=Passalora fulva TaxID=5499 RepID=A0A9Q8L973_PASFU|nr:Lipase B [Fulvia fulva]KAK4633789.1 Lipase B [Fulvia fulva]UJO13129.1 Lipase B [Fulvia fulva]WPV11274.1 Lipase B [Fulvia fulva]
MLCTMSPLVVLILLFSVQTTIASPIVERRAPTFVFDGDAPFSVSANDLAASLTCPYGNPSAASPPVLLIHGTATTGQESWGDGYVPALKANGFTACYITIPNRAMGDMQVNAEYVAYNIHAISSLSGNIPTAVITHSQGGPVTQWALQFWPSTRSVTRAFVALSPDFHGVELLNSDSLLSNICSSGICQASLWQQSAGSHWYDTLHAHEFSAQVPTTSIWTQFDGVVTPAGGNAQLPGANVVSVQSLCPLRPDSHVTMTISSAAYALALDALRNNGVASMARVRRKALNICLRFAAPGMNVNIAKDIGSLLENLVDGVLLGGPKLKAEPAIAAHAQ